MEDEWYLIWQVYKYKKVINIVCNVTSGSAVIYCCCEETVVDLVDIVFVDNVN